MITGEIINVRGEGITLERLIARKVRSYLPGYVERVLDINPGLAALGPILPVGAQFLLPAPSAEERGSAVQVIKLWD